MNSNDTNPQTGTLQKRPPAFINHQDSGEVSEPRNKRHDVRSGLFVRQDLDVIDVVEPQFRRILNIVWLSKKTVLVCVLLGLGLAIWGIARTKPLYESTAIIQIDPEVARVSFDEKTVVSQNRVDPEYFNTQLKLLTSPSLAKQCIVELALDKNPNFEIQSPTSVVRAIFPSVSIPFVSAATAQSDEALPVVSLYKNQPDEYLDASSEAFLANLQISQVPRTRLLRISYQHPDPKLAQQIANTVAIRYIKNNLERRVGSSKTTSEFLQQRVADLQTEINDAESDLIGYGKNHEIASLEPTQNTVVERLIMLNRQLVDAEAERIQAEASVTTIRQNPIDSVEAVQSSPTIQSLQARLSTLKQKETELLVQYTKEWPEVKQIQQTVAQVTKELNTSKLEIVSGIKTRFQTALEREKRLRGDYNQQLGVTLSQNEKAVNYRIKNEDIGTKKELYKSLLTKLKESDISASSNDNNIMLTNPALIAHHPVSPNIPLTLIVAFGFSLCCGTGIAFSREYFNNRITSIEDVDRFVNLPTLGQIPTIKTRDLLLESSEYNSGQGLTTQPISAMAGQEWDGQSNIETAVFSSSSSQVAESYRQFRTSLLLSTSGEKRNRVLLVTSSLPGEGKTTTSVNTATSLAQTGARVILLDCDLRRPRLHTILGIAVKQGLSTYLAGQCLWAEVICETRIPNLDLIPSGDIPSNPTELIGSARMGKLLEQLTETYEYVVLDTPPLLSFADAAMLSAIADGVVLVVHSEKSKRDVVQLSARRLRQVNANVLGIVLNATTPTHSSSNYYYGYGRPAAGKEAKEFSLQDTITALQALNEKEQSPQTEADAPLARRLHIQIKPPSPPSTTKKDAT